MTDSIFQTLLAVVVSVGFCLLYFAGSNWLLDHVLARPSMPRLKREALREGVRPWLFLAPALLLLGVYLVYPFFETFRLSFMDATGEGFVGLANYAWVFTDANFFITIRNNFLWLLVVPAASPIRAARCWAAPAPSTAISTCAARPLTTTCGPSSAAAAGRGTTCCRSSSAPKPAAMAVATPPCAAATAR